ncbi:MAG: ABC transporter ATP-binding protein [Pseudomonadota bacterium]
MTIEPVLSIRNASVHFKTHEGIVEAVKSASLDVLRGETLAIVGESGSGKSQLMMAVMGLLASNGSAQGSARLHGKELIGLKQSELNKIRGREIGMIFQEPMTSLDPLYRIDNQLMAPLRYHQNMNKKQARARALELLKLVHIRDPEQKLRAFPHELSGGQRQRVMIAMALANRPELLIADEPTTALDVTIQAEILKLLKELQNELGMGLVFITHDLNIVRQIADRVIVMQRGEIIENNSTAALFDAPQHPYTKRLLEAEPTGRKVPVATGAPVILEAKNVNVRFKMRNESWFGTSNCDLHAVNDVSLTLRQGQTIGIVGESGSGKSTLARAILRLVPSEGQIVFEGRDITHLSRKQLQPLRREIQVVLQDPFGSLSPRLTAGQIVTEGLLVHEPSISSAERDRRAIEAFREVSLDPATRNRYPHEFSGGQRQRIAIARALILHPKLIVLDEPTSALDREVQKQIVDLLRDLQQKYNLSYLFISHDLVVVRALSDHIMVMKDGRVVEEGPTEQLFTNPVEPYTQRLLTAALGEDLYRKMKRASG